MYVRMCVNNLDLHEFPDFKKDLIHRMKIKDNGLQPEQLDLEEYHCLGHCYLCQHQLFVMTEDKRVLTLNNKEVPI